MATAFAAPQFEPQQPVHQVTQEWTPVLDFQPSAFVSTDSVDYHSNNVAVHVDVAVQPPKNIEEIRRQWAKFIE